MGRRLNSMDSVSDRDYVIELSSLPCQPLMMHLSRFCEEVIIWNTNEYRFVEIDDAYSTGSSIMPQKKNPDIAELVRGKSRPRLWRPGVTCLTTMKGIPLAYNKDMQEDKELVFDAIDTTKGCLALFTGMIRTMRFNETRMENSAQTRIYECNGCSGLSGKSWRAISGCAWDRRTAGSLLYRKKYCAGRYVPGRIPGNIPGI